MLFFLTFFSLVSLCVSIPYVFLFFRSIMIHPSFIYGNDIVEESFTFSLIGRQKLLADFEVCEPSSHPLRASLPIALQTNNVTNMFLWNSDYVGSFLLNDTTVFLDKLMNSFLVKLIGCWLRSSDSICHRIWVFQLRHHYICWPRATVLTSAYLLP